MGVVSTSYIQKPSSYYHENPRTCLLHLAFIPQYPCNAEQTWLSQQTYLIVHQPIYAFVLGFANGGHNGPGSRLL